MGAADNLQERVREISDALYTVGDAETSYIRGIRSAMAAAGLCSPEWALPIGPFTTEEQRLFDERFEALGCTL